MIGRGDDNILKRALTLEVNGQQKRERPKQTEETSRRECKENWVGGGEGCKSNMMERGSESDH